MKIIKTKNDFGNMQKALEEKNINPISAEVEWIPTSTVQLPEDQAQEVDKVKRSESGMIVDPVTINDNALVSEALAIMGRFKISGVPVTDGDGRLGSGAARRWRCYTPPSFSAGFRSSRVPRTDSERCFPSESSR